MALSSQDLLDVWADSYILMCLSEFNEKAKKRLMNTLADVPQEETPEQWRESFEGEFSITVDHAPGIVALWEEQKRCEPTLTPQQFAERNRREIFSDILF